MVDYFPTAMTFIWRPDCDGQPLHVTPNDPGGSTSWGVTFQTWASWQRLHGAPVSMAGFMACGKTDFLPLYRALFWNATRCGDMGAIGIQVMDAAMMSGPGNAARFLQHVLGVDQDGQVGPITLSVLRDADPPAVNRAMCTEREAFYAALPTARYFERGWDARAERCRDYVALLISPPLASTGLRADETIVPTETL